jgi:Na+/H+ antiporter NhaD/arsenite permease-like protein
MPAAISVTPEERPIVLALFVLTYFGLAVGRIPGLKLNRTGIALLGAIGMMIVTRNSTAATLATVNWPTIALLFGFFVISAQLRLSGFYDRVATAICERLNAPVRFLGYLVLVVAGLSAFLNNDVVCYVLAPVVGAAAIRKGRYPVPFLVAIALASNIGAGFTLIGNAQNMMIGQLAGLGFLRYLVWSLTPVLVALAATYLVTGLSARSASAAPANPSAADPGPTYPFDAYHTGKGIVILAAVVALFFTSLPHEVVVLVAAGIHLMSTKYRTEELLGLIDWPLLLLFMALFVVSGTFQASGYAAQVVHWLDTVHFDLNRPANEVVATAVLTVLINNAPAVMLLVKLVALQKTTAAFLLAAANSFSGNAILTASVANIIVVQQARQQGITISFGAFAKIGLPVTALSLAVLISWSFLTGG